MTSLSRNSASARSSTAPRPTSPLPAAAVRRRPSLSHFARRSAPLATPSSASPPTPRAPRISASNPSPASSLAPKNSIAPTGNPCAKNHHPAPASNASSSRFPSTAPAEKTLPAALPPPSSASRPDDCFRRRPPKFQGGQWPGCRGSRSAGRAWARGAAACARASPQRQTRAKAPHYLSDDRVKNADRPLGPENQGAHTQRQRRQPPRPPTRARLHPRRSPRRSPHTPPHDSDARHRNALPSHVLSRLVLLVSASEERSAAKTLPLKLIPPHGLSHFGVA